MLQYLLNTTAIWSLGLIVYYSMLRKESFHGFNRLYLIGLLVAGIGIPFITWETSIARPGGGGQVVYSNPEVYIEKSDLIKRHVVAAVQPENSMDLAALLWAFYLAGVCIGLVMLLRDGWKLWRLYSGSAKTKIQGYTLVETGREMSPCSFAGSIFISGRDRYNTEELNLVISHELRHIQLKHTSDLVLTYVIQVLFWFHPLVYIIRRELVMVHEYQADSIARGAAKRYGYFLVEQAMISSAPALSHSFAHSPLKNRIKMLTKKSTRWAQAKKVVILPLALVCALAFSNCNRNAISTVVEKPEKNGTVGRYKGNVVELELRDNDTTTVYDSETGAPKMVISSWADRPLTLNGKTVHTIYSQAYHDDIDIETEPVFDTRWQTLGDYLFENLKADFEKLDNGKYNMLFACVVIDEHGKIAYYDYSGVQLFDVTLQEGEQPFLASQLDNKIYELISKAPAFAPATIKEEPVPCEIFGVFGSGMNIDRHGTYILVQDHKASLQINKENS